MKPFSHAPTYFHYFNPARIPLRDQSPEMHDRLYDLHLQRVAAEETLAHMLLDQTPDTFGELHSPGSYMDSGAE
jgi:hypothetical protein